MSDRYANYHSNPVSPGRPLPPLKSPLANPSTSRALNLELQKTRANVMDSIQAESNARSRLNHKFESQISLAGHEFNPKIHTLDRQSSFTKKQLASLLQQITEINAVSIQNIKNSCENSKLQLEQKIKQDSISRLNPITEEQRGQGAKIQKVTENIVSFFSKISDSIRDLDGNFDKCDKEIADYNRSTSSTMSDITPRIAAIETKATALEATAESFVRMIGQTQDMINKQKEIRDTLKNIEDERIDNAVSQMGQDAYSVISTKTTELDQRISTAETEITSLDGSLQSAEQSQIQQDSQVENMSRKYMELEGSLKSDEEEILGKLNSLDKKLQEVKTRLLQQMEDHTDSVSSDNKFSEDDFNGNVQHLSDLSALDLKNLTNDWKEFTDNNKIAQNNVDEIIFKSINQLQGKPNIVQRVKAAEQRIQWCLSRLDYWARDDAKRKRSALDDSDAMLRKVSELEDKVSEFEANLQRIDGQEARYEQSQVIVHYTKVPVPPVKLHAEPTNEKICLNEKLKLTYSENDEFQPLKKSKEDEERAAERLKKLQEQKEKRKERLQQMNEKIENDFVNEQENQESPKKQSHKKTKVAKDEEEDEKEQKNEDDEEKVVKEEKKKVEEEERVKPTKTQSMERLAVKKQNSMEKLADSKKTKSSESLTKPAEKAGEPKKNNDSPAERGLKSLVAEKVDDELDEEEKPAKKKESPKKNNDSPAKGGLRELVAEKVDDELEKEEEAKPKKPAEKLSLKADVAAKADVKDADDKKKSDDKLSLKGGIAAKL